MEVWAPDAAVVEVVRADGSRQRLRRDAESGWHRGAAPLSHGDTYWFALDGRDELLPDPRSHHQPEGIDGPSAVVDHGRFRWTDAGWGGFELGGAVLYELHVGTFSPSGTFDGAIGCLDHLVDLGVDAVEVMPIAEFVGERGWGYDGVLLFAPHHAYGGPDGFKRFVDACHARGLGVVLDVVYNHLGPVGNHLQRFGPYFHDAHSTPWGQAVNLDGAQAAEVRFFLIENARHWFVDHHVDALRLDAVHALFDDSDVHFLEQLDTEVSGWSARFGRRLWLIAEDDRPEPLGMLDAQWRDNLHHALHAVITGERDGYYAPFGALADVAAAIDDDHPEVPGHQFVVCTQNHDQIGNRAMGDRLSHIAGVDAQMAAAAIVLCSPFIPLLFQGEEWAASTPFPYFCDVPDAGLAEQIRNGRRDEFAAFGWDPSDIPDPLSPDTAASAVLRWDERSDRDHARVLAWYRALIGLRRRRPDLRNGDRRHTRVDVDEVAQTLVLWREHTVVAVNLSDQPRRVALASSDGQVLAQSHAGVVVGADGSVDLPGYGVAVVDRQLF